MRSKKDFTQWYHGSLERERERERERESIMERWRKPEVEYGSSSGSGSGGDHPSRSSLDYKSWKPELENNGGSGGAGGSNGGELPRRSSLDYNTPLRSVLRNFASAPSPFYKLSSELSRESLRIPGAVPFMWEQSPGRRKFSTTTSALAQSCISPHNLEKLEFLVPEIINVSAADPEKPSLASLFRESDPKGASLVSTASASPVSSAISQIAPPPSADHPRSSSARYSIMQRSIPTVTFHNNAALHDGDEDATSDATSDALTATAGGVSVDDDSFMLSGEMQLASTPSEARDFIMHRFLPAAHTIACDSPQTPSRRFLPPGMAAAPTAATSSLCNGSFRDHAAACGAAGRPSPLLYSSVSSTPGLSVAQPHPQSQLRAGSFHDEEEEEEEEEEEPPFTPRACGIFPFHIHLSFHNRHRSNQSPRRSPSSKHQDYKQQKKTNRKSVGCSGTPTRIMDILNDDHSSSPDDESPVHRLRSRKVEAEREHMKVMAMERAVMYNSSDPRVKPLCASENCYRGSPNVLQCSTTQKAASDPYNEEACEYNIYQDAPSRFNSPSPAALHLNTRANTNPPPASVIISTTEQHLLNSSFYYTAINRPQCANPTTNLNTNYPELITNQDQWEANNSSPGNHITQKAHIITNALYEYEDRETSSIKGDHCISRAGDNNVAKNGDYYANNGGYHVINNDHYVIDGNPFVINGGHQGDDYVRKGGKYVINGGHQGDNYAINDNYRILKKDECPHYASNGGDQYIAVSNADFYGRSMDYMSSAWPRSLLLSPPLPKSPTHSWLDRAIPLAASTNKSLSSASRLSHMHKASTSPPPADHHDTHTSYIKASSAAGSFADSRWEALVKGSHLQPGHLRFSKELCHQSSKTAIMKVGAS